MHSRDSLYIHEVYNTCIGGNNKNGGRKGQLLQDRDSLETSYKLYDYWDLNNYKDGNECN